ncbi:MAG: hypothetical protein Rubg2KO_19100 [Rubricoccaceae bacterium]
MRFSLLIALLSLSASSAAQPVPSDSLCACEIRLERDGGALLILQGPLDPPARLGRVGLLGGGLADVVQPVPAAFELANAASQSKIVSLLAFAGGAVAVTYSVTADPDAYSPNITALGAGIGLSAVGLAFAVTGGRQQRRAVEEYNRSVLPPAR